MRRRISGFTLIELLVVIAIIAILAAILFPVFARARKKAQSTRCISNLRQIGTALAMYLQTNNDRYPKALGYWPYPIPPAPGELDARSPNTAGLARLVHPWVRNPAIWVCPSGARRDFAATTCSFPPGGGSYLVGYVKTAGGTLICSNYTSYPLNVSDPDGNEYILGMSPFEAMAKWGNAFSEGGCMWAQGYRQPKWNNRLIQCAYIPGTTGWRPHFNATNILFYDGHAACVMDYRQGKDI